MKRISQARGEVTLLKGCEGQIVLALVLVCLYSGYPNDTAETRWEISYVSQYALKLVMFKKAERSAGVKIARVPQNSIWKAQSGVLEWSIDI